MANQKLQERTAPGNSKQSANNDDCSGSNDSLKGSDISHSHHNKCDHGKIQCYQCKDGKHGP